MYLPQTLVVADSSKYLTESAKPKSSTLRQRPSKKTKAVRFGSVVINEHPVIAGCNPAVSSGVPMTIGWYPVSRTEMSVREFEAARKPERVSHRLLLKQHPLERYTILQNLGFSRQELQRAEQTALAIRELREQSYLDDVDEGDRKLRRRLRMLYDESQRIKQRQQQQQQYKFLSSLRRMMGGGGGGGILHHHHSTDTSASTNSHITSKGKSSFIVASH